MYDPVPDLAALIDGLRDAARYGGSPANLGEILVGPYARLRGGLLLDEPGREDITTGQAIREALGQPVMPPVPDSSFAWIPPGGQLVAPDLPVISAATAIMSYQKLVNQYVLIWPEDRIREVRRRLLRLAGNLPETEREQLPAWLLREIHSDLREQA